MMFRHKKRGGKYEIIGKGALQAEVAVSEGAVIVAYRAVDDPDGPITFRPEAEFKARFDEINE